LKVAAFPLTMPVLPTKLPLPAISFVAVDAEGEFTSVAVEGTVSLQTLPVVKKFACAAAAVRVNAAVKVTEGVRH
jgi:hypothetical protein